MVTFPTAASSAISRRTSAIRGRRIHALAWIAVLATAPFLVSCSGTSGGASDPADPPAAPATVSVAGPSGRVAAGATAHFVATVTNAASTNVNWEVNGIPGGNSTAGTIGASGLYTAPASVPSPATVSVTAVLVTDATKTGSATITVVSAAQNNGGVFAWRNDSMLSGVNSAETLLTPATVSGGTFGKLFACPVDGEVYAQPLYMANLSIPTMGLHNVVFVATENDSVYAFDADATVCQTLWQTSFLTGGATPVPSGDTGSGAISPEIGITGTPAIDPVGETLFVVSKTKLNGGYVQQLHALDLFFGGEKSGGPVAIQATVKGTGDGNNNGGQVPFDPLHENQNGGLLLSGGLVYVVFGGYGNTDPFHGWAFAYNAATLGQVAVFNTTANGARGGIGPAGASPSADSSGNIFLASGNGSFDLNTPRTDYGETVARLGAQTLAVADFFTPFTQAYLNASTLDLGSSGILLLPNQTGSIPHMAMVGSQQGILYLLNRDNLGQYAPGGPDHVVDQLPVGTLAGAIFGTPALWTGTNTLYIAASGDSLKGFSFSGGVLTHSPSSQSSAIFGSPGASPAISSNGSASGIVWMVDTSGFGTTQPAVLHAYDATNLSKELYDSSVKSGDAAGDAVPFVVPTVFNGKVFVGTQTELSVYGLLP